MKDELIGKDAQIGYNDRTFEGSIINETKNMIYLKTNSGIKKLIKQNVKIKISGMIISGKKIVKRPEERIKLKW